MGIIRVLPDALATQIAAGEVVAGPHSIVKELAENSIDAGATRIDIAIEDGGRKRISVADNGCGMDEADATLCTTRFATSKTRSIEDLHAIRTLGFRGEALGAIAAVSLTQITTRSTQEGPGVKVDVLNGRTISVSPAARQPGTTVTVRDLFNSVPARKQFLGTAREEAGAVQRTVIALALAHAAVHFTLSVDGKEKLNLAGETGATEPERLLGRIRTLHGGEFAATLLPLQAARAGLAIHGYVSTAAARGGRRSQIIVNNRPVKDFAARKVIANAFSGLIPGTVPDAIVVAAAEPATIDVNVTPDKSEIRFRDKNIFYSVLFEAARSALAHDDSVMRIEQPDSRMESGSAAPETPFPALPAAPREPHAGQASLGLAGTHENHDRDTERTAVRLPEAPPVILQLARTFLFVPADGGVFFIDQHSAHERVLFEKLAASQGTIEVQDLLVPERMRLSPHEAARLDALSGALARCGFDVAPSGPAGDYWIHSAPAVLRNNAQETLRYLLSLFERDASLAADPARTREAALRTIACKAAIKSGDELGREQMKALYEALQHADLSCHDVHGRPAVLFLSHDEVSRRMGRASFWTA